MSNNPRQPIRKPATKFANLQKKILQQKLQGKTAPKKVGKRGK